MNLYKIIKSLQTTQGNNAKQAILEANKDNELLKQYMKAMLDPTINYYITKIPKVKPMARQVGFDLYDIQHAINVFAGRMVTGNDAKRALEKWLEDQASEEDQKLVEYLIKRQIPDAKVGETMVLKTWPGLFFIPPYMRCKGMDEKVRAHYGSLKRFIVQIKRDASFAYLWNRSEGSPSVITRQGNTYPQWLADRVSKGLPEGLVLSGELEVYENGKLLDRKTGNGIMNSVAADGVEDDYAQYTFRYVGWDLLTEAQFQAGYSYVAYEDRLEQLEALIEFHKPFCVELVEYWIVNSVAQAKAIHIRITASGKEGTVWKTCEGYWKSTDSGTVDQVKVKVVFEAEFKVTGYYEGKGKAKGSLGGFTVATDDEKIINDCGTGFSDADRLAIWQSILNGDTPVGWIVTLEANDIISSKTKKTLSLSLPVFIERRFDKKEADSLERVLEQLEAAKQGK